MVCVVAPVFHKYEMYPAVAVNVAALPWQTVNVPVMLGTGLEVMVTACEALPVHPLVLVTVTVYVPAVVGLMVCVVAPVFHK